MNSVKTESDQNILLVAGDGRNVGKTYWCCKCIEHLSKSADVIAVKISPHFHNYKENNIIIKTEDFVILQEKEISRKDSSLMLQAGAKEVYFVMCKKDKLKQAFTYLRPYINNKITVVESGGLHKIIKAGLFFFLKNANREINKTEYIQYKPIVINNTGKELDFDVYNIEIEKNTTNLKLSLKKYTPL